LLTELSIRDIALIPELHVRFGPGLNVLSGETGAGKSLVVGSLRLLCGARPPEGFVRAGAKRGVVEGIFSVPADGWIAAQLRELGVEPEDDELILRREIATSGKGRVRANGQAIPLRTLAGISELLIDLHGQHDHQSLLRPSGQLQALDEVGDLLGRVDAFARDVAGWRRARRALDEAREAFRADSEKRELLRLQRKELREADVQPGERDELLQEGGRLEQAEFLRDAAARISHSLVEADEAMQQQLAELAETAEAAATHDAAWEPVAEGLSRMAIDAAELGREAAGLGERAVDDPARLAHVRDRVRLIDDLLRKYGPEEADLLAFRQRLEEREIDPEEREARLRALEEQVHTISDKLVGDGQLLGRRRQRAARTLERSVEAALATLGMEGTRFRVSLNARERGEAVRGPAAELRAGPTGLEDAEFLMAANRGEEPRPLRSVASGGEISRVMLALKSVAGERRGTATMVFDEIDAGVGGTVASRVAEVMGRIAEGRQVLCITHLAPIASVASTHLRVHKDTLGDRTVTSVTPVADEERVLEVARMLGSSDPDGVAVDHARELLTKERA